MGIAAALRRAIRRLTAIGTRAAQKWARFAELVRMGRTTSQVGRFVWRERRAKRPSPPTLYRLRGTSLQVLIRHGCEDPWSLDEVFARGAYLPPQGLRERVEASPSDWPIVDAGGYIGAFGLFALQRFPGRTVISIEPDPTSNRLLTANSAINADAGPWIVHHAALGTHEGVVPFDAGHGMGSRVATGGEDTLLIRMMDLFEFAPGAAMIKMDVEGSEWDVIGDPRMAELEVGALALEWHLRGEGDTPKAARADLRRSLEAAGFRIFSERHEAGASVGFVWAAPERDAFARGGSPTYPRPSA